MEEQEIETKLPDVSTSIKKFDKLVTTDWKKVHEDLSSFNWLEVDPSKNEEICNAAWLVCDRWALNILEEEPRFKIVRVNKVKLFIGESIYALANNKSRIHDVCLGSNKIITDLLFFRKAKNMLLAAEDDDLPQTTLKVHEVYKELRQTLSALFVHLDKHLKTEVRKDLKTLLDEQFFTQVVNPNKDKLEIDADTNKIVTEYDRSYDPIVVQPVASHTYVPSGYNSTPATPIPIPNINYTPTPSSNPNSYPYTPHYSSYSTDRENVYYGELDENGKRAGYGKIKYFNGDNYEGYWENDKPSGKGIYTWKDWGKYEGEFANGVINGIGKRTYTSGNLYFGAFRNGRKEGRGEMKFKNGDIYAGDWRDDDMHGEGKYTWKMGDVFEGTFKRDKREGRGTLTLLHGDIIQGEWIDGELRESVAP